MSEQVENYSLNMGKLVANMQSLEFILRGFLHNREIAKGITPDAKINYNNMRKGNIVPNNAFTNCDTLRDLIHKYNTTPEITSANLAIDETLVDIRDAIAHGRISSDDITAPMHLLKFKKPKGDQVEVSFSELMTKEWLKKQVNRFRDAVITVNTGNEQYGNR